MKISGSMKRSGALTLLVFLTVSFLIFRTDLPRPPNLLLYNLINLFALHFLGSFWGVFFLSASLILTTLISFSLNLSYLMNLPLMLFLFFIADSQRKKNEYYCRMNEMVAEEIKGNINLLASEYSKHRQESSALEKKLERYTSLRNITAVLSSQFCIEEIAKILVDKSSTIIEKSEACLFFLVDTEKQELALLSAKIDGSSEKIKEKKGDLFDQWVFKQHQRLLVEDIKRDFRFNIEDPNKLQRKFRSLVVCPLVGEKKVIGIIRLESRLPGNFTADDLRLLDIISDLGAVSIQNAKFYKKTFELAITDSLTGLYLRRYFLERLNEELKRALHTEQNCSLLMLDIDNFKNYNDLYGHAAGDIVLKKIADVLNLFKAEGDIVSRYGGEEFSIILPQTTKKEAKEKAEALQKKIKDLEIFLRRERTKITVSIGVATFPQDAKFWEDLIMKTDEALYKAKRQGKDQVAIYEV